MTFNRRDFLTTSSLALAGAALARVPLLGQPAQQAPPQTTFKDIRRNVGFFTGQGGTIGWLANPAGRGRGRRAVSGDGESVRRRAAAEICEGHRAADQHPLPRRSHRRKPGVPARGEADRPAGALRQAAPRDHGEGRTAAQQAYADVTFGESWSQEIGDEKVWGYYYGPGHTGGDAVIVFERANVVHMGDLMFNRLHPRVDGPSGASMKNWISILERVAKRHGDATFIFGHAKAGQPVTGPAKELLYLRDYLTAALQFVQKGIAAKQPKEEIAKATELPGFAEHASSGSVLTLAGVLNSAYDELTR